MGGALNPALLAAFSVPPTALLSPPNNRSQVVQPGVTSFQSESWSLGDWEED